MPDGTPARHPAQAALLDLFHDLGAFGATESGGTSRLAASAEDGQARDFLCAWLKRHGFEILVDPIGNIFGVLDFGRGDESRCFFSGSHLDSQPDGGRFDGTLGVACACVAGVAMQQAIAAGKLEPTYRFYVAACWTGEEGARFQPSLLGSSAFVGSIPFEWALARQDQDGVSLRDALSEIGYLGKAEVPKPARYLEIHIEQGARLEAAKMPMGVVSSCWGAKKIRVLASGRPDHTGPTPMEERRDALLAASQVVVQVNKISRQAAATLYSSVGRLEISPNSPNTIADKVQLWIEFRSDDGNALSQAERQLRESFAAVEATTGCGLAVSSVEDREVVEFDEQGRSIVEGALSAAAIPYMRLSTIAGHDAIRLQSLCPSTLLFIPSKDGISHSPEEFTSDEDICTGFEGLLQAISSLISAPPEVLAPSTILGAET